MLVWSGSVTVYSPNLLVKLSCQYTCVYSSKATYSLGLYTCCSPQRQNPAKHSILWFNFEKDLTRSWASICGGKKHHRMRISVEQRSVSLCDAPLSPTWLYFPLVNPQLSHVSHVAVNQTLPETKLVNNEDKRMQIKSRDTTSTNRNLTRL